jgi:hypothetical protein
MGQSAVTWQMTHRDHCKEKMKIAISKIVIICYSLRPEKPVSSGALRVYAKIIL